LTAEWTRMLTSGGPPGTAASGTGGTAQLSACRPSAADVRGCEASSGIWVELVVTDSEKRVMQEKRRMKASLSYRVTLGFRNELGE
jgi:hypothetical protein